MESREIPESQWPQFFDQFSRLHRGKFAQVHTADGIDGWLSNAEHMPLLGVTDERRRDGVEMIRIMLASPPDTHISHAVPHPTHVRAAEWNGGYSASLEIECADGPSTTVQVGPEEEAVPTDAILDGRER